MAEVTTAPASDAVPPALLRVAATTTLVVLAFSMLYPVLAVRLHTLGASNSAVGFFAMLPFLSIAAMVPLMPTVFARLGVARAYRLGLALEALATLGYASTEHYGLWCVLAVLGGVGAAAAWNGTEALIAHNAPAARRGRLTGLYQTGLGAALALGPFLPGLLPLSPRGLTGVAVGCLLAALGLALSPSVSRLRATREGAPALGLWAAMRQVPSLVGLAFAGGVFEAGLASVTSAQAAGAGLSLAAAASIAGVLGLGSFVLQYPTGWVADHLPPRPVFVGVGVGLLVASALFALSPWVPAMPWVSAFLWGAVGGSLYTLTMTRVAHTFAHSSAVAGASAVITGYTAGGALGPAVSGVVFDTLGVAGQAAWLSLLAVGVIALALRLRPLSGSLSGSPGA